MKKMIALWLALLMLACGCAPALAEDAQDQFVFRGGVTWGMTRQQVEALEGRAADDAYEQEAFTMALYNDVQVSRYSGMLVYLYVDDQLRMAAYGLNSLQQSDIDYLARAMSASYGEYQPTDEQSAREILEGIMGKPVEFFQMDGLEAKYLWTLPDGTLVFGGMQYSTFGLFYICPDWQPAEFSFTFRNGVTWNMSQAAVVGKEGREADDSEINGSAVELYYEGVKISRFDGDLTYCFQGDALKVATYTAASRTQSDFEYLVGALTQVYGAPQENDRAPAIAAVNAYVDSANWSENFLTQNFASWHMWTLEDGTMICAMYGQDTLAVVYLCPMDADAGNDLDLTGL